MSEAKFMSIREFKERGYLQEVNRRFLHPLGLALAVQRGSSDQAPWTLSGVLDARDDPEGFVFDDTIEPKLAADVQAELSQRAAVRKENLGFVVQPVPELEPDPAAAPEATS